MEDKENNEMNEQGQFGLPEGYFERSAASIFNKIEWEEEHKDFPKLKANKGTNPFGIPGEYFTGSESRLELAEFPTLTSIKRVNSFTIPEDYFETNSFELYEKLGVDADESVVFEKLDAIKKQDHFKVEESYFENNETHLIALLETNKRVRVINLFVKRIVYAAAAVLTVVTGLWIYSYYFAPIEPKDCGTIACVDRIDLVKTKNLEALDNDELYDIVNIKVLEKKLEEKEAGGQKKDTKDSSDDDLPADLLDEI